MKIEILGTKGEIEASAPYHSKHSGVLIDGNLMFDLGEKEFLKQNPKHIFITHLHPDHAFFVLEKEETNISAYAPEEHEKAKIIVLSEKKKFGAYLIIPIPTIHSLKVKSQAYLVKKGNTKILYTGDLVWLEKKYHKLLKNLDLVVTDGSFFRKGGMVKKDKKTGKVYGHNGVPNLVNLFSKFGKRILFIHFGSWFYKSIEKSKKKVAELGEEKGIETLVGYDGMVIEI